MNSYRGQSLHGGKLGAIYPHNLQILLVSVLQRDLSSSRTVNMNKNRSLLWLDVAWRLAAYFWGWSRALCLMNFGKKIKLKLITGEVKTKHQSKKKKKTGQLSFHFFSLVFFFLLCFWAFFPSVPLRFCQQNVPAKAAKNETFLFFFFLSVCMYSAREMLFSFYITWPRSHFKSCK